MVEENRCEICCSQRIVLIFMAQQTMVDDTYDCCFYPSWYIDMVCTGFRGCSFYLYIILIVKLCGAYEGVS